MPQAAAHRHRQGELVSLRQNPSRGPVGGEGASLDGHGGIDPQAPVAVVDAPGIHPVFRRSFRGFAAVQGVVDASPEVVVLRVTRNEPPRSWLFVSEITTGAAVSMGRRSIRKLSCTLLPIGSWALKRIHCTP